ncbi:hypothetical protein [Halovivax limisalsi]|uniref:hypothetical protein n=1 Tax=Halovivax limisalsi TaxID=1453760 RepID=UPI001FFCE9BB|nr:hypothetical protein [Halovivax limisalsi]
MSQQETGSANEHVREVYEELGELLEQGDDVFVEEGPALLEDAIERPGFLDGLETEHAEPGEYTRKKVIGDPGRHVIRYMEWPPEYALMPHEHHGRPCFEVLVEGHLALSDLEPTQVGENEYTFEVLGTTVTEPGESAVVDPRENEIHAVYSPVRSRSLHVYPDDSYKSYGYVYDEDADGDVYERKEFQLREDDD